MRIRKLEISGFKSFCDRTLIHFDSDVIGIVGPNGCGKSNIVDAIRWAMGEQSAKHLRGRAMSDVIFNGSETRGAAGLAEVTLTFDNGDVDTAQQLPLEYRDYAEIAVARRLYRDGTSEYLINKTQVRLKDVTDLFLGTGVGTKAYSIIEQGKIGLIVSARAEDRRLLIEEAAGITKYKARRKQAELKMDQTRQNLLRVGDIVSEIERSLATLKRQAAKAERWVSYRRELEDLVLHEASHRFLELVVTSRVEGELFAAASEHALAAKTALGAREAELEVVRQAALSAEERAEAAQSAAFKADNEVRTHESDVTRARDRLRHLDEKRVAATKQRDELETSIVAYDAERTGYEAQLRGVDEGLHEEEALALEEHERLDELRQGERASEDEAQQQRRRLSQATSVVAASEATLATFARRMTEIGQRRVRLEDELGRLAFEREELSRKRDDMRGQVTELGELKAHATEERARLEGELRALREDAVGRDKAVDQAKNELHQRRSRLRALEELHQKLEGVGTGVRNLLGTKDASLGGLFADRVEAPEHLTQAFAGLLGAELQAVVVSEPTRALALLDDLRRSKKGRATVVAARPRYVAGARAPLPTLEGELSSGVVCFLVDELRYEPEDEALVRALVGDAVVVERAEVALALRAAGATHTLVTREGTVLHADGRIAGGMGDEVAAHMVEQKREIRELHDRVAEASQRVSVLLDEQTSLRQRLADATAGLERARADAHRAEIELLAADKDEKRAEERLAHAERREGEVRRELEELEASLETAREEEAAAREKVDVGIAEQDRAHAALEHAEMVAADWRERVMGQQSVVTERKVGLAKIKERARSLRDTVERLARSCEELRARIVKLDDEREHAARDAGKAAAVIWLGRERLSGALFEARRAEGELRVAREGLDAARAELGERELALRGLRAEASEATTAAQKHEMSLEKLRLARESLEGGVRERFRGLELARVVGDFHKRPPVDAAHRARIQELGELIERMGPVNVDAVREHKEAQERFSYYDGQKKDLEKALDDLDKAIAQMNRESKRLFRATFDGVNQNFKTLFPTMFRGGQAELRLTNPDDLLETGIEILAQPPGKKLGTIELMSGGEKALTAVALIFAIFQFKPSPFCILDEVDAPLDEANVARYNDGIRRMTDRSQFILITHIKRTMQSVDVLYGVTMQEAGVSKLVSVRVNESGRVDRSPAGSAQAAAVA